jgi:hypothetical protein
MMSLHRVECCVRCLAQGVGATHIIDGRQVCWSCQCQCIEIVYWAHGACQCKRLHFRSAIGCASALQNHSLLMELLTDEGVGSMIVGSSRKIPAEHKEENIREAVPA